MSEETPSYADMVESQFSARRDSPLTMIVGPYIFRTDRVMWFDSKGNLWEITEESQSQAWEWLKSKMEN